MPNPIETKIGELVRDLTLVGFPTHKSQVRRRINEILELQKETMINEIEMSKKEFGDDEDRWADEGKSRAIEIIKSIK